MAAALLSRAFTVGVFRFTLTPKETLFVPAINKANMLRGAFGHAFRRLCCVPQCIDAHRCPLASTCPYKRIFEPSPPADGERLSGNRDIPRPFVFRAPADGKTRFEPGEEFEFGLVLIGKALDHLPYFVLSFRELASEGMGLNRAKCELKSVREEDRVIGGSGDRVNENRVIGRSGDRGNENRVIGRSGDRVIGKAANPIPGTGTNLQSVFLTPSRKHGGEGCAGTDYAIYDSADQVFRTPKPLDIERWIEQRINQLSGNGLGHTDHATSHGLRSITGSSDHSINRSTDHPILLVRFLTPTLLKAGDSVQRRPDFHHIIKRLRDRINALSTFFGSGPLDVDFAGLGSRAEQVRTVSCNVQWEERFRTSSKTRQRHPLSGFVGEAVYAGDLSEFLPWLAMGELVHVGKHTAWGMGGIGLRQYLALST